MPSILNYMFDPADFSELRTVGVVWKLDFDKVSLVSMKDSNESWNLGNYNFTEVHFNPDVNSFVLRRHYSGGINDDCTRQTVIEIKCGEKYEVLTAQPKDEIHLCEYKIEAEVCCFGFNYSANNSDEKSRNSSTNGVYHQACFKFFLILNIIWNFAT